MGLFSWSWLRRDIELRKLLRRQIDPPAPSEAYNPNSHREEYIQAFGEFTRRGSKYKKPTPHKEEEDLQIIRENTDDTQAHPSEDNDLVKNEVANTTADIKKFKNQPKVESELGNQKRHSLPSKMSRSLINKSFHRNAKKSNTSINNTSANNNTIYEDKIFTFDGDHRMNNSSCGGAQYQSPPKKFYRDNSIPFSPHKETVIYAIPTKTPKKIEESRQKTCAKFLRYISPNSKKNQSRSDSSTSRHSGSFKHYDSSLSEEVAIPQKPIRQSLQIPSQVYEKSVNKHGDLVEYALPYSDLNEIKPVKISNENGFRSFGHCEGVIDDNFKFLNDSKLSDCLEDENGLKIETEKQHNVTITDLDKSFDGFRSLDYYDKRSFERNNNEVLSELESLGQWSRNIPQRRLPNVSSMPAEKKTDIIECKAKEIKQKISVLRNTIATPLDFASGVFRKTSVTLRKCCPRDLESIRLVEDAIERDYEILSKIKHSNIVLLMAACINKKLINHMTLVLEPVDYTLNYFLHQMDEALSLFESISVVQQIATASLYLQECGYIHSNISSHNILVRKHPWCVKLSSFELTTEVDCSSIRAEIEINYGRLNKNKSFVTECMDVQKHLKLEDKNVPLKEQYKQMSKQSPILKCLPNTQHAYISMPSKYLVYNTNYRQHLSLHNFQAPELLTTESQFVFPTTKTDVYSLCLLLWEILNKCVPFVVYSKLDMERMITKNKLNLPFFERDRCNLFMSIFSIGLAVKPDHRTMDIQQLITMLEDIKFEIHSSREDLDTDECYQRLFGNEIDSLQKNFYVNTPPVVFMSPRSLNKTASGLNKTEREMSKKADNSDQSMDNSMFQRSFLEFNKCLEDAERTSTLKKRKPQLQKCVSKRVRELFKGSKDEDTIEEDIQLSYAKLNENLDAIADDIRMSRENILDEFKEKIENQNTNSHDDIIGPLIVKQNELPSKMTIEKHVKNILLKNCESQQCTTPEVVGYKVKSNSLDTSKSVDNLLDTPVFSSVTKRKLSDSPNGYRFTIGEYSLPQTPIARKNKIRRDAWLANQKPCTSQDVIDDELMPTETKDLSEPLDDSKALNVSIRIIHNKITPKKNENVKPSVLSMIKLFDSGKENPKNDIPVYSDNRPITPRSIEDNTSSKDNLVTNSDKLSNGQIIDLTSEIRNCLPTSQQHSLDHNIERNGTFSNASTLPISQKVDKNTVLKDLKDSMMNCQSSSDHPKGNADLFENKLWKREMDICNKPFCSNDDDDDSNVVTPKWQSVRDTIMKFEKRGKLVKKMSSSQSTPNGTVSKISETMSDKQQNYFKYNDTPTLIKRTIYRESILSGVNLTSLDQQMPFFDQINMASQKLTTRVTLNMRQIRGRSSDVGLTDRCQGDAIVEGNQIICGSDKGLLTFNAGTLSNSLGGNGSSSAVTKDVCSNCASKMSTDELKAWMHDPATNSTHCLLNGTDSTSQIEDSSHIPQRRCQALINTPNSRSIEDLYIDDDFLCGLGANMELQSDCSDFLDFDMIATECFKTNDAAASDVHATNDKSN